MSDHLYPQARILVFSKAPVAGRCKTRLMPMLGRRGAARLQRELLEKTLDTAISSKLAPVELWCSPSSHHTAFRKARLRHGIRLQTQPRGNLGTRMHKALQPTHRRGRQAILIGTDCPTLTANHLHQALAALAQGSDVVICPAEDGGYVLVGTRTNLPRLFHNIPWGKPEVMAATRRKLNRLGVRHKEMIPLWDVDHPHDLRRARSLGLLRD